MQTVRVEQKHIKNGLRFSATECPVALALKEFLKTSTVFVGACVITVNGAPISMPSHVRDWISAFDMKKPVEPLTFEVRGNDYVN